MKYLHHNILYQYYLPNFIFIFSIYRIIINGTRNKCHFDKKRYTIAKNDHI